jgi:hypothetical protein
MQYIAHVSCEPSRRQFPLGLLSDVQIEQAVGVRGSSSSRAVGIGRIMLRSLRIEYPGAVYHVLNRGNYRHDVFGVDGSKERRYLRPANGLAGSSMRFACSTTIITWP